MNITLDDQQAQVLRDVVTNAFGDLRFETADTDNPAFKRDLKEREAALQAILDQLGAS